MDDVDLRYTKGPGLVTRVLAAVGVGALVTSIEDQELDAPDPKVVTWTPRSAALRRLAAELVAEGRDDGDGWTELARAAGRRTKELRRAAATVRQGGWAEEDEPSYRVDRLLRAAAAGRGPGPVDGERLAWFARVRTLAVLPTDRGFAVLSADEPALATFVEEVRRVVAGPGFDGWDGERRIEALSPVLHDRLPAIVVASTAPLVRTRAAWFVLRDHAYGLAGVMPPDAYAPPVLRSGPGG